MSRRIIYFLLLLLISCSKNSLVYEDVPEELLFRCVDYSFVTDPNFDSDNLYAFWDIFVADAKFKFLLKYILSARIVVLLKSTLASLMKYPVSLLVL